MKRYFSSIKQYSWILIACLLLSLIAGLFVAKSQPSVYQVSTVLLVTEGAPGTTIPGASTGSSAADSLSQALNYAAEIPTRSVMRYVISVNPELQKRGYTADDLILDVIPSTSTTAATVSLLATATHNADAVLIANGVANGFVSYIQTQAQKQLDAKRKDLQTQLATVQKDKQFWQQQLGSLPNNTVPQYAAYLSNMQADSSTITNLQTQLYNYPSTINPDVSIIQPALPKDVTTTPKNLIILGVIALIGLLIGTLIMLLMIFLDKRLRSDEEVKEKLGLAYLGSVSNDSELHTTPARPQGTAAREISDIAANLRLTGVLPGSWQAPQGAALLVTSPQAAEGKSTLATALAATLARGGATVVVVDGNLRQPSTHLSFGINAAGAGLSGLLKGTVSENVDDVVVRSNVPGVWLLPAGPAMDDATLLLEQKFPGVLRQLRRKTDVVIIDGPALLTGADASLLATMADGVALVADTRHDKLPLLLRAKGLLDSLTHTPAGIIMNRLAAKRRDRYYATPYISNTAADKWVAVQAYAGNGNGQEVEAAIAPPMVRAASPFPSSPPIQSGMPSIPPSNGGMSVVPPGMAAPPAQVAPMPPNDIAMMQQNPPSPHPGPRRVAMTPPPPSPSRSE